MALNIRPYLATLSAATLAVAVMGGTAEMFVQPACLNCHSERDHDLRL